MPDTTQHVCGKCPEGLWIEIDGKRIVVITAKLSLLLDSTRFRIWEAADRGTLAVLRADQVARLLVVVDDATPLPEPTDMRGLIVSRPMKYGMIGRRS